MKILLKNHFEQFLNPLWTPLVSKKKRGYVSNSSCGLRFVKLIIRCALAPAQDIFTSDVSIKRCLSFQKKKNVLSSQQVLFSLIFIDLSLFDLEIKLCSLEGKRISSYMRLSHLLMKHAFQSRIIIKTVILYTFFFF